MALLRTITVLVKLPGNKTETLRQNVPAEWISGDKDAMSEVIDNPKVRTKISVVREHLISVQIGDPWDSAAASRVVRA
jgi:hypothetical protein